MMQPDHDGQKKTTLGMTPLQLGILAILVILLCASVTIFVVLALYPTTAPAARISTLADGSAYSATPPPSATEQPSPSETPTIPPADTPTDTATPSATPTATQVPEPTAVPTKGVPLPPDTTDNIHVAQIFTGVDNPAEETGKVDLVWGSAYPDEPAGVFNLYYLPFDRDGDATSHGRELAWFLANHADWIEYTCDKKTPAYEYNDPNVPLDITNPAVIDYMMQTSILPAVKKGYQGIAFDNVDFGNNGARCGVWKDGNWIKQTNYVGDILTWAAGMYKTLHGLNVSVAMNFSFDFNDSTDSYALYKYMDIDVDERGFTNRGKSPDDYLSLTKWLSDIEGIQYLDANGKGFVSINEMPEPFAQVSQAEMQWALANYLLVKGQHSYIAITGIQEYGHQLIAPEYSAAIGHPLGPMYQSQGVYMRDYSNGLAIVNPSSFGQTFNILLPGRKYQDLYGSKVNLLTLAPQSGSVLLKTAHASNLFFDPTAALLSSCLVQLFRFP
ncbi:MAG TPA: putative glycoside hydrolase [Anaerolineales bacterium]|nr:putative glycoside hydrolase [Anaerolineales bacterium]